MLQQSDFVAHRLAGGGPGTATLTGLQDGEAESWPLTMTTGDSGPFSWIVSLPDGDDVENGSISGTTILFHVAAGVLGPPFDFDGTGKLLPGNPACLGLEDD